jgi:hypothetical protein
LINDIKKPIFKKIYFPDLKFKITINIRMMLVVAQAQQLATFHA